MDSIIDSHPWIILSKKNQELARFAIFEQERWYRLGRDSSCDFVLPGNSISAQHMEIKWDLTHRLLVRDLDSLNGVLINSRPVKTTTEIYSDDVVQIGDLTLTVAGEIRSSGDASSTIHPTADNIKSVTRPPARAIESSRQNMIILIAGGLLLLCACVSALLLYLG